MNQLPPQDGRDSAAVHAHLTSSGDEQLIDIRDLASWLGVSKHTVRRWVTEGPDGGRVPRMLRVNGQVRFRPQDVRDWLNTKEVA